MQETLGVPAPVLAGLGELTTPKIEELGRVERTWRIWGAEHGYCHVLLKIHPTGFLTLLTL